MLLCPKKPVPFWHPYFLGSGFMRLHFWTIKCIYFFFADFILWPHLLCITQQRPVGIYWKMCKNRNEPKNICKTKKGLLLCVFIFLSNFGLMGSPHVPTDLTSSVSKGNKGAGVTRNHFQLYSPTRKHSVDYKLGSIKVNTKGRKARKRHLHYYILLYIVCTTT